MFSKKSKYALCACLSLARHPERNSMVIAEISKEGRLPQKFLESILQELRRGGVVHSRKGRHGGYSLVRPAKAITIGEIFRLTGSLQWSDGTVLEEDHLGWTGSPDEANVSRLLSGVRHSLAKALDETSLQDILDRLESTRVPVSVDWVI